MVKVGMIGNGVANLVAKVTSVPTLVKSNYDHAKADLEGKAVSQARRIKPLREFVKITGEEPVGPRRPEPTKNLIRTKDGHPMVFYDDGSLRHALGRPGKKARKAVKKARRHATRS